MHLVPLVLAVLAVAVAPAQAPEFPAAGSDPTGVVLDEQLQPVAGAIVELVASADTDAPFARAIGAILQRTPLPRMPSQRDGSFVLPLTAAQRGLGAAGEGRFWLRVQLAGYRPWLEPLAHGLNGYLGSRVVLRRERADDPFADVPWPPSPVALGIFQAMPMWCPLPAAEHLADRRGPPGRPAATDAPCAPFELVCVDDSGRPVAGADLLFDGSCFGGDGSLPAATDAAGRAALRLPAGEHRVRVAAPGLLARICPFVSDSEANAAATLTLTRGETVDILAVDGRGRPVPFARVDVVAFAPGPDLPPSAVLTDSQGRVRVQVRERAAYFAYQEASEMDCRVGFGPPGHVVLVRERQEVTLLLRGVGDLSPTGDVVRMGGDVTSCRAFDLAPAADRIVTRAVTREVEQTWWASEGQVPVCVRRADLPPAPDEPLLDLVALDRPLRMRARLRVRSTSGDRVRRITVRPSWQGPPTAIPRGIPTAYPSVELARIDDDGNWTVWARDDGPYQLRVYASKHEGAQIELPPASDAAPPELTVELQRK